MVFIKRIDFIRLKQDLLEEVGPSGIWELIMSVDDADERTLIKLAKEYGFDLSRYIIED